MKKILLFLCLLLLATSCATQKNPSPKATGVAPVYYDGNDKPAAYGVFRYSDENQQK
jgi:hypothetical protein